MTGMRGEFLCLPALNKPLQIHVCGFLLIDHTFQVVREEDIREFFTQMQARKRQRVAPSMFHNCR